MLPRDSRVRPVATTAATSHRVAGRALLSSERLDHALQASHRAGRDDMHDVRIRHRASQASDEAVTSVDRRAGEHPIVTEQRIDKKLRCPAEDVSYAPYGPP